VSSVNESDVYILAKHRALYWQERELTEQMGELRQVVLLVADEPELALFAKMPLGNSYSALMTLLNELQSHKVKWMRPGYQIKVASGRTYVLQVDNDEFTFAIKSDEISTHLATPRS
jgi:hypothetical protein